jgi:hypothetical protein
MLRSSFQSVHRDAVFDEAAALIAQDVGSVLQHVGAVACHNDRFGSWDPFRLRAWEPVGHVH